MVAVQTNATASTSIADSPLFSSIKNWFLTKNTANAEVDVVIGVSLRCHSRDRVEER
jgi:hypothetical protein